MSTLFYADDIVIISRSPKGSEIAFKVLEEACAEVGMKISVTKSQAIKSKHVGINILKDFPLEFVLVYKYLGVKMEISTAYYMTEYSMDRAQRAKIYCTSTIALAKDSPCPALFAWRIWTAVAIPAIMYGCEAVMIRKKELIEIEREQARLAKFILQVPQSTCNAVAQVLADLELIEIIYWRRILNFYGKLHVSDKDSWQYKAFREMMDRSESINYNRQIQYILNRLDVESPKDLEKKLSQFSAETTNRELQEYKATCFAIPSVTAQKPTRKSAFFDHTVQAKTYHEFLTLNADLGNRHPREDYAERFLNCPLCYDETACFNELHILFACEKLDYARNQTGIDDFMRETEWYSITDLFLKFMQLEGITSRLEAARRMKEEYTWLLDHRMEL